MCEERAPREGISPTVSGVRGVRALIFRGGPVQDPILTLWGLVRIPKTVKHRDKVDCGVLFADDDRQKSRASGAAGKTSAQTAPWEG